MLSIIGLLFKTYPLYNDRPSRRAVQSCLESILTASRADVYLPIVVKALSTECSKPGIAPNNAFVLVEWAALVLQKLGGHPTLVQQWLPEIVAADAKALELCAASARPSVYNSALVVTRRGLRKVFMAKNEGEGAVKSAVTRLTAIGAGTPVGNAVFLGVIAGVCARLEGRKSVLATLKKDILAFYGREIIGSRTVLPGHISNALHDFFIAFLTYAELKADIVPPLEKALLRAPEIVLNGLIPPLVSSLPDSFDLSEVLAGNLLKPLLSNTKSANPAIRSGALAAFEAVAERSGDDAFLAKVVEEILGPVKTGKVPNADQRAGYVNMLYAIRASENLSPKISQGVAAVTLKEASEPALDVEAKAMLNHITYMVDREAHIEKSVLDALTKGCNDKRPWIKKIWALRIGEYCWSQPAEKLASGSALTFLNATISILQSTYTEVISNPLPAAQSGLIGVAFILAALSGSTLRGVIGTNAKPLLDTTSISSAALTASPKLSFLLNPRIYSKLTAREETLWMVRALASAPSDGSMDQISSASKEAWSQAFLYMLVAPSVPYTTRQEAVRLLTKTFVTAPEAVGDVMVKGLWLWLQNIEVGERESAAVASGSARSNLYLAIRSLTPSPSEAAKLKEPIPSTVLKSQLVNLLVLCRPDLIPRAAWIDTALRVGIDPGQLASEKSEDLIREIQSCTEVSIHIANGLILAG